MSVPAESVEPASPEEPQQRRSAQIEEWVSAHWDLVFGTVAAIFFAISSGVVPSRPPEDHWYSWIPLAWTCVALGAIFFVLAGVSAARKSARFVALEKQLKASEKDRADLQNELDESRLSVNRILDRLCEQFGVAMLATHQDRVTIYTMHSDDFFVRLARKSRNPTFESAGRVKYPKDEGIVGEAWENEFAIRTLPRHGQLTKNQWVNSMEAMSGIPKKKLKRMQMRSKVLVAQRVSDHTSGKPCAVVVYESVLYEPDLKRRLERAGRTATVRDHFRELFESDLGVALVYAVAVASRLAQQIDPDAARREGF